MATMTDKSSRTIPRMGYGAMVLEGYYGGVDDEQAEAVLRHAIDKGLMIDTADAYGGGNNEKRIAKAIAGRREQAFVATKFGIVMDENEVGNPIETGWELSFNINGSEAYMNRALDASLERLKTDYVDLYYIHAPDPQCPIEETVSGMAKAVAAGKARYLGLSNVTAEEARRAHAVHPIAAVQYEYSLWRREAETELLPTLRELGIALVAWSPLGAGFLAGPPETLPEEDFRNLNPRFTGDNLQANRDRFAPLREIADGLGITSAQLVLAWLLHQGDDIYAIPGSRQASRVDENAAAAEVALSSEVLAKINEMMPAGSAKGATLVPPDNRSISPPMEAG